MSETKVLELGIDRIKFVHVDFDGWHRNAHFIKDKKELELWLTDGSLQENDVLVEVKAVFKVRKWKDGSLCYEEIPRETFK